jgi:hypothetical protein
MADNASNLLEFNILSMLFLGTSFSGLWDNDATSPLTSLSVQLHTASPTDTGDLTASEATYTGYTRIGVERTSSGWTVAGSSSVTATVSPATNITFPIAAAGTNTITHFSIGDSTVAASTGRMFIYGTVTPNIAVSVGVTPRLTTATAITLT